MRGAFTDRQARGRPFDLRWDVPAGKEMMITLHEELVAACQRALPWIAKMIADGAHLNSVAPNDCVGAMEQLQAVLARAKRGCGKPTYVEGTNGGMMPCGAMLTRFGETKPYFCAVCEPAKEKGE
jgi:hypothetical protein